MELQSESSDTDEQKPFQLKGSLFTLAVIQLRSTNLEAIDRHLAEKALQAPAFFSNAPVIIELDNTLDAAADTIDFTGLCRCLRQRGMIPVGIRNIDQQDQPKAIAAGLPILPEGRLSIESRKPESATTPIPVNRNRMVTQPVRSGQQLYAPEGDLVLLSAVSAGAEVLADGNIHIYGALRGRALAGVRGDTQARIFCQSLEAELVSIAGHYRVIESPEVALQGKAVQIYLDKNERLVIDPLNR